MKNYLIVSIIVAGAILCTSCKKEDDPLVPTGWANMVLVKFNNPEQMSKLIVQHPFNRIVTTEDGYTRMEYDENTGLYLNVAQEPAKLWADKEMHIAGTSPYIPLTDGYYMVDWKWHKLHPLCTFSLSFESAYINPFEEHILHHCFITDIDWKDVHDVTEGYDNSRYAQHVSELETVRVTYRAIDQLYNDLKKGDPYVCYNRSLYSDGLDIVNAYAYYVNGNCSCDPDSTKTYSTYIAYCDSLQAVYQQRLIKIIEKRQLNKVELKP